MTVVQALFAFCLRLGILVHFSTLLFYFQLCSLLLFLVLIPYWSDLSASELRFTSATDTAVWCGHGAAGGAAAALGYSFVLANTPFRILSTSLLSSLMPLLVAATEANSTSETTLLATALHSSSSSASHAPSHGSHVHGGQHSHVGPGSVNGHASAPTHTTTHGPHPHTHPHSDPEHGSSCCTSDDEEPAELAFRLGRMCEMSLQVALPVSGIMYSLALPLSEVCFAHGNFDSVAASTVAPLVRVYALAGTLFVVREALLRFIQHSCVSGNEALKVAVIATLVKLAGTAALCGALHMGVEALALSTLASYLVMVLLLAWRVMRHLNAGVDLIYLGSMAWCVVCAGVAGCVAHIYDVHMTTPLGNLAYLLKVGSLILSAGAGLAVYLIMALGV